MPEIFEVPSLLCYSNAEGIKRRFGRPYIAGELNLALFRIERDQKHVVDRRQRPDHEDAAEQHRASGRNGPPQPVASTVHSCISLACSIRIIIMASGTS